MSNEREYTTVNIFLTDDVAANLMPLRRALSNMIEPLPLVGLVEWVYLTASRHPALEKRLHSELPSIDLPIRRSMRTSTVRMDGDAMKWLLEHIPIASASALVTTLFFWLADNGLACHQDIQRRR